MSSQSNHNNIDAETEVIQQTEVEDKGTEKECFVIMPISDSEPYEEGHFKLVYEHLIKPACLEAGFKPIRADDVANTSFIVGDIIDKLVNAEMAICDLSGKNPNVLFELGIRQAFNLPVTLIKDEKTARIFDIQGLRDVPYDEYLRVDNVKSQIIEIKGALKSTYDNKDGKSNSLIHLLSIRSATLPQGQTLNPDTSILLEAINRISYKITQIKDKVELNYIDPSNNNISFNDYRYLIPIFKKLNEQASFEGNFERKFEDGRKNTFSAEKVNDLKL